MCGIFGVLLDKNTRYTSGLLKDTVNHLFILSESRGKEAAGIAILRDGKLTVHKEPLSARYFIRKKRYRQLLNEVINDTITDKPADTVRRSIAIIGHTRLITNGLQVDDNSPIISDGVAGVHNGIVVNDDYLWRKFPSMERKGLVDSEVIFGLLNLFKKDGLSLIASVQATFSNIQGSASIAAFVSNYKDLLLATNTGSLYSCRNAEDNIHIFASEFPMLQRLIKKLRLPRIIGRYGISQLKPGYGCIVNIHGLTEQNFSLD